ncbi:MAG TPA: VWA domain-containing protein [Bryobacteraceae bacterium]|nr:VWA domain-containing protein [Bryobacteraceae bacterium]
MLGIRASRSAILIAATFVLNLSAQDDGPRVSIVPRMTHATQPGNGRPGAIRLNVDLVLVPVTVTDPQERPVKGLRKDDFRLFEDESQQEITQFYSQEAPISIGIVFDSSLSMTRKMEASREAISNFVRMSLPGDEFFLLRFSDRPESLCAFTKDVKEIEDATARIRARGWTALYDAIYLGVNHMKRAAYQRKVLFVLSDGEDNNSRYSEREILNLVREADVRIFAISILDRSPVLERLAEETGGRAFRVRKLEELPDLAESVSAEIHSEYVLGYSPEVRPNDGKYRKLKVELVPKAGSGPMRASWRRGYYGPAE